ncbi:mediator of RNA polymerase II transcription subunit 1-like isoform X2 [Gordionus sp. m RMFG-2023]|uniref:mediator of RNA polymerase II transcription subunit 1-like isoform X2 n=1 Tax=Gordionus sp. m RMFG-2023 TaxID=3053472 RepID=UPI0031FCEB92
MFYIEIHVDMLNAIILTVKIAHNNGEPIFSEDLCKILKEHKYSEFLKHLNGINTLYQITTDKLPHFSALNSQNSTQLNATFILDFACCSMFERSESFLKSFYHDEFIISKPFYKKLQNITGIPCSKDNTLDKDSLTLTRLLVNRYLNITHDSKAKKALLLKDELDIDEIDELDEIDRSNIRNAKMKGTHAQNSNTIDSTLFSNEISDYEKPQTFHVKLPPLDPNLHPEGDTFQYSIFTAVTENENDNLRSLAINNIPFTHPTHIPQILNVLRQQMTLNTLVDSCLSLYVDHKDSLLQSTNKFINNENEDSRNTLLVNHSFYLFILTPNAINLDYFHDSSHTMIQIEFDITDIHHIKTKICTLFGDIITSKHFDNLLSKMDAVIQKTLSIPLTMRVLVKYLDEVMASIKNDPELNITGIFLNEEMVPQSSLQNNFGEQLDDNAGRKDDRKNANVIIMVNVDETNKCDLEKMDIDRNTLDSSLDFHKNSFRASWSGAKKQRRSPSNISNPLSDPPGGGSMDTKSNLLVRSQSVKLSPQTQQSSTLTNFSNKKKSLETNTANNTISKMPKLPSMKIKVDSHKPPPLKKISIRELMHNTKHANVTSSSKTTHSLTPSLHKTLSSNTKTLDTNMKLPKANYSSNLGVVSKNLKESNIATKHSCNNSSTTNIIKSKMTTGHPFSHQDLFKRLAQNLGMSSQYSKNSTNSKSNSRSNKQSSSSSDPSNSKKFDTSKNYDSDLDVIEDKNNDVIIISPKSSTPTSHPDTKIQSASNLQTNSNTSKGNNLGLSKVKKNSLSAVIDKLKNAVPSSIPSTTSVISENYSTLAPSFTTFTNASDINSSKLSSISSGNINLFGMPSSSTQLSQAQQPSIKMTISKRASSDGSLKIVSSVIQQQKSLCTISEKGGADNDGHQNISFKNSNSGVRIPKLEKSNTTNPNANPSFTSTSNKNSIDLYHDIDERRPLPINEHRSFQSSIPSSLPMFTPSDTKDKDERFRSSKGSSSRINDDLMDEALMD